MKLPTVAEMEKIEQNTINDYGIDSMLLMENAGLGTVLMAEKHLGPCANTFSPIFVGPGSNGGDGLVIGRHLHQRGCRPLFFFLSPPDTFTGDTARNFAIIEKLRLPFHIIDNSDKTRTIDVLIKQCESQGLTFYAVFDAIFGIGLSRNVAGHYDDTIRFINSSTIKGKIPIIAVDGPSGLNCDTGEILGNCVRADYTATFGCAKPGHFLFGSRSWIGKLEVIDVGIPPEVIYRAGINTELANPDSLRRHCSRLRRQETSHKGTHGHLLVLAGSSSCSGAAILAARGALRSGAGLVTMASTRNNNQVFQTAIPEAMTLPMEHAGAVHTIRDWESLEPQLDKFRCMVLGPGLGQDDETAKLILKVFYDAELPVVVDADALNILSSQEKLLHPPKGPRIYTPHPGELSRMLGKSMAELFEDRLAGASEACTLFADSEHETVMVVKGIGTIVCSNHGKRLINTTGNPGMATGGMGDVLAGMIGAFVCQELAPFAAAITGVYLHGYAADMLYEDEGPGYCASEVADLIPTARHYLVEELFPSPTI